MGVLWLMGVKINRPGRPSKQEAGSFVSVMLQTRLVRWIISTGALQSGLRVVRDFSRNRCRLAIYKGSDGMTSSTVPPQVALDQKSLERGHILSLAYMH